MSNIQAEDDFIYGNPSTTSARQASWENQLLDDYDQDYAPGQRVCIDDASMMDWDKVAQKKALDEMTEWAETNGLYDDYTLDEDFEKAFSDALDRDDKVNSPSHYRSGNIECIEAIEEALTDEELRGYFKGNCLKYLWREQYKNQLEDLRKAKWYLDRLVSNVEAGRDN